MDVCMRADLERTAIVLNDQLGRGRSSTTAVIVLLIRNWLRKGRDTQSSSQGTPAKSRSRPPVSRNTNTAAMPKTSWQIINSCLRVIRSGLEVKKVSFVDIEPPRPDADTYIDGRRSDRCHRHPFQLKRCHRGLPSTSGGDL
jgi:hypothetical protein